MMLTRFVKQITHPYFYLLLATLLGAFVGSKWNVPLAAWLAPIFLGSLRYCVVTVSSRAA